MTSHIILWLNVALGLITNCLAGDPFTPWLDGKAPEIIRELPVTEPVPGNITLRKVIFRLRGEDQVFAAIATPKSPGKHPGILLLHGGGGAAEVEKAKAWAQRGYVAVAPDLPGIGKLEAFSGTKGHWDKLKYGQGRWVATPDGSASVIFDAVLSAMKSLYLLRAQPELDPAKVGVVGVSWGGYMTTMVCSLAGDQVRAGFSVFGCGFYDLTSQQLGPRPTLGAMPEEERQRWLRDLDAGRRAPGIKAAFFIAAATNDFFYWPRAVQATLDAVPGEKNQVFAPNISHKIPLPGGSVFTAQPAATPFQPTEFQPYSTPQGSKANWLAMEVPYFDFHLKGTGEPLPRISVENSANPRQVRFNVESARPLTQVQVWWAADAPVPERKWNQTPVQKTGGTLYEAQLPGEATDWFALVSDDRPVSVSSALRAIAID